jgi:adenosine deaminase CECR1
LRQQQYGYRFYARTRVQDCGDNENSALLYQNISRAAYDKLSACRKADFTELEALNPEQRRSWMSALVLDAPGEGRNEFFEEIVPRMTALFRSPHFFADGFAENLKQFGREGVRYIEAQWSPLLMEKPDGTPYPVEETLAIFRHRMEQDDVKAANVAYRFQTTVIRFRDDLERQVAAQHEFIHQHRDLWVGINAAGREDNDKGYALRMLNAFREARRRYSGIPMSIHAGEKDSPGHEVRDTLILGARRIGHGVNLISDPETMLRMRAEQLLVEINLVSNRVLEYTPDLSKHPFPEYLRFGIPVCLNTDDRGSWDSNMTDEYMHAVPLFKLTWDEVKLLGRNSLTHSFAPDALKQRLLADYDRDIAAFERRFLRNNWKQAVSAVQPAVSNYAQRTFALPPSSR